MMQLDDLLEVQYFIDDLKLSNNLLKFLYYPFLNHQEPYSSIPYKHFTRQYIFDNGEEQISILHSNMPQPRVHA